MLLQKKKKIEFSANFNNAEKEQTIAYITRHNFGRLGIKDPKDLPIEIYHSGREPILYNDSLIDNWFSELEINQLLVLKALIDNDYNRYGNILNLICIITPQDNYSQVNKPSSPAFHKHEDCPFMHSDYENYTFPANFKEIYGENGIDNFRNWFKQEGEKKLNDNPQSFLNSTTARWPGKKVDGIYYPINWEYFVDSKEKTATAVQLSLLILNSGIL